jgi:hypothetical protein
VFVPSTNTPADLCCDCESALSKCTRLIVLAFFASRVCAAARGCPRTDARPPRRRCCPKVSVVCSRGRHVLGWQCSSVARVVRKDELCGMCTPSSAERVKSSAQTSVRASPRVSQTSLQLLEFGYVRSRALTDAVNQLARPHHHHEKRKQAASSYAALLPTVHRTSVRRYLSRVAESNASAKNRREVGAARLRKHAI